MFNFWSEVIQTDWQTKVTVNLFPIIEYDKNLIYVAVFISLINLIAEQDITWFQGLLWILQLV